MKVWTVREVGGPFIVEEHPLPQPTAGEVLIRVAASGVNPLDTKIRAGKAPHARHGFPAVLGLDFAGIVEISGSDVTHLSEGDAVYGMAGGVDGISGSLSEFMVADASLVARKPKNLTMIEAAAMPLAFITAWEGLVDRAKVQPGYAVLIHGGAGGVGNMAVQLATALRANVHATVSPGKKSAVQVFGAAPIDYLAVSPEEYISLFPEGQGWDVVYDTVGGKALDDSFKVVKKYTGHAISCLGWAITRWLRSPFVAPHISACLLFFPCSRANSDGITGRYCHALPSWRRQERFDRYCTTGFFVPVKLLLPTKQWKTEVTAR